MSRLVSVSRVLKKKVNISDPAQLIPELPSPDDLKPFPTQVSIEYKFHQTPIRSISVSPCGNFLASADEDSNLVIWQVSSGRIMRKYKLPNKVIDSVEWNPNKQICLLAVCNEEKVFVIQPQLYRDRFNESTSQLIKDCQATYLQEVEGNEKKEMFLKWEFSPDELGVTMIVLDFNHIIKSAVWHAKGDYLATMIYNLQSSLQVMVHSLSKASSQRPLTSTKGSIV